MKTVGNVITLFLSDTTLKSRIEKDKCIFDKKGILGDKYYNKDIQRSVLLTSLESYNLVKQHNITMPYGSLGENLLIDYSPYHLVPTTQLHIGTIILEISQYCTICEHLCTIDERVPSLLKNHRGIFAKVIQGGEIKKGDEIKIIQDT